MKNILLKKVSELENEGIELMKNLIRINAVGPKNNGPGENEKAKFLKEYLQNLGIEEIKEYPAPDASVAGGTRPNLVALIPGQNRDQKLWLISHMDIVPEGDRSKWATDPFEPVIRDGKIYGRGSEDNHQGLVSSLLTVKAFLASGIMPHYTIGLAFVSDEETGSTFGLEYLVNNHPDIFAKEDIVIIPDAGANDGSMIEIAEKSIMWVKIKTIGKQVHASLPDLGINAFRAASHLVVELENLRHLYNTRDDVFDPPQSTFEPTKKEANVPNINTLPGEDVFYLDCRILPNYGIEEVFAAIRKMADKIETKFLCQPDCRVVF